MTQKNGELFALFYRDMTSPVGMLRLVASDKGLRAVLWEDDKPRRVRLSGVVQKIDHPILLQTEQQLNDYFAGKLKSFTVELDLIGSEFQKKVWAALLAIPFGETRSYSDIARQIGHPNASRAVGAANGRNPISIITPCHRVVGSDGNLTGFAGGRKTKEYLLRLEAAEQVTAACRLHRSIIGDVDFHHERS